MCFSWIPLGSKSFLCCEDVHWLFFSHLQVMTAHGLRQLPATVSGCFVFSLSQKLVQCSHMLSRRPRPCRELYTWHAVGRVFCILVFFLFWSNFFLSCLWGRNQGEHTKGREGRSGNPGFPRRYAEWKIVTRIPRLHTSGTGKKKIAVFRVTGARAAWLFVPGQTVKLLLRVCVQNSGRCKQVAKVTNAITKWKFKVQL